MTNTTGILDECQKYLHDATTIGQDGRIWTRSELLAYLNDGYRAMLSQSQATRRFTILDMPGSIGSAITHGWEQRHTAGTYLQWGVQAVGGFTCSALWEVEQLEGIATTPASEGITQPWERAFFNPTHASFRFALPRDNERIVKLWHDHQLLLPVAVRELDAMWRHWMSIEGEPLAWTQGTGRNRTFEVYEVSTAHGAGYVAGGETAGMPISISGVRTYEVESTNLTNGWAYTFNSESRLTGNSVLPGAGWRVTQDSGNSAHAMHLWEKQWLAGQTRTADTGPVATFAWEVVYGGMDPALPAGRVRSATSPDRQYLATGLPLEGVPVEWHSSVDNLLLLEVVSSERHDLSDTEDSIDLVPPQMAKYLRDYVLSRAWGRQGEGYIPSLSQFCAGRFERGVSILRRLSMLAMRDRQMARQPIGPRMGRPPRPRLPSTYPRVGY